MSENNPDKELLDHSWRHFEFHAKQRLSLFNFFVVLCGLILAAWATVMTADKPIPLVGVLLSLLLSFFSYVFWRMDQRNADLTKRSERLMGQAEKRMFEKGECLFCQAEVDEPLGSPLNLLAKHWSHGTALRVMFSVIAMLGIAGAVYSASCRFTVHQPLQPSITNAS